MIQFSYWESKHFWNYWDFTIIGSGITGLTAAIFIKKKYPKAVVTVLERGMLPSGASTKNAGFACFGSMSEILDDLKTMSENTVFDLLKSRYKGLKALRSLLPDSKTGYIPSKGFEIFTSEEREIHEDCMQKLDFINEVIDLPIGHSTFKADDNLIGEFGFSGVSHIISNQYEGTIDTGLMMRSLIDLARDHEINIYNGVEVTALDVSASKPIIQTNYGPVSTGKVIIATNGFAKQLFPERDVKPARAQVIITKPIENLKVKGCFHHNCGYNYFRNIDGRILLGGGRHLNKDGEETYEIGNTDEITNYLEELLREVVLPDTAFEIDSKWSGIMGVGKSKEVILEEAGPSAIVGFRFGGMGIALGTEIGKQISRMV